MKDPTYKYAQLIFIGLLLAMAGCIEPYNPPATTQPIDILVVDGFLNSTDSSAVVRLSKAVALSDGSESPTEHNAYVRIEDESGNLYPLPETGDGIYSLQKMNLNSAAKYRLSITRSNDEEYVSDYIKLKISPPIDSITYRKNPQTNGLAIYVNTHDASNSTHYYQWTFEETWEYTAGHYSTLKIKNGVVIPQDQNIYQCWTTKPSTEIHIGSTAQLQEDVIRNYQLISIPNRSQKVSKKYSLEVQQRALPKEAYDFWLQLKKTTESLGSLFDPLPAQVLGNLRSTDDARLVLGYFSGGHISKKRIFIHFFDLPTELRNTNPRFCPVDTIELELVPSFSDMNLITYYGFPVVLGYLSSEYTNCLDCREEGGVTKRPDFWE